MEGRKNPHVDKYKAITNDWYYDASCMLTSIPVWDYMSVLLDSNSFVIWCGMNDVDREVTAVVIALEFNGLKQ
jgi:hypothetical protein